MALKIMQGIQKVALYPMYPPKNILHIYIYISLCIDRNLTIHFFFIRARKIIGYIGYAPCGLSYSWICWFLGVGYKVGTVGYNLKGEQSENNGD